MASDVERTRSDTFVVKVMHRPGAGPAGVIHHVRTGEKRSFDDVHGLAAAIAEMSEPGPQDEATTP
jgi:hypothetical protein